MSPQAALAPTIERLWTRDELLAGMPFRERRPRQPGTFWGNLPDDPVARFWAVWEWFNGWTKPDLRRSALVTFLPATADGLLERFPLYGSKRPFSHGQLRYDLVKAGAIRERDGMWVMP